MRNASGIWKGFKNTLSELASLGYLSQRESQERCSAFLKKCAVKNSITVFTARVYLFLKKRNYK